MATYYVAKFGSDSNNGGPATPFLTIQQAANIVAPGDIVNIETGTYGYFYIPNSGGANNYITFQNYLGQTVNIDGSSGYDNYWTHGHSYIHIIGLNGIGTTTVGVELDGTNNILENCSFSGCTSSGIEGGSGSNLTITGCVCFGTNTASQNECISLYGINGFTIKNCIIHDPAGTDRIGIDAKNGCSNGDVYGNSVYNCGAVGIYVDGEGLQQSNIKVHGNLVFNNGSAGLAVNSEVAPANQTNISFYNNIVYNNGSGFTAWATPDFAKTFTLINNTFYNNGDIVEIGLYGAATNNLGSIIRNNIIVNSNLNTILIYYPGWINDNGADLTIDNNLFYDAAGYNNSNVYGTNYVIGNPLFNNPTTDFTLRASSPAIGAGLITEAPSTDFAGNPWTGCIGAYQYQSGGFNPNVAYTANFTSSGIVPSGKSCSVTVTVGTSSGSQTFASTGTTQNFSVSVTMPSMAGTYPVYIDIYMEGTLFDSVTDPNPVVVS
jgi:hypothetical protein